MSAPCPANQSRETKRQEEKEEEGAEQEEAKRGVKEYNRG
jgi:hypothetical protein